MANICFSCGVENKASARHCDACGKALAEKKVTPKPIKLPLNAVINNRYIIRGIVAITDMGAVYLGEDKETNEIFAVKELRPSRASSDNERVYAVNKFVNEGKLMKQLNFISVPRVQDYFIFEGNHYLIMEFVEGLDLETMVTTTGSPGLSQKNVIQWGIELCELFAYLHNFNPPIIYRDLKPANIMVRNSDNRVVLIDFGIAIPIENEIKKEARTQIGTVGYMPPEQFRGIVSPASDIFSLGATLYFLLVGQIQELFNYKPMANIVSEISEELDDIVKRCLKMNPQDRFASAVDLKKALEDLKNLENKQKEEIKQILKKVDKAEPNSLIYRTKIVSQTDMKIGLFINTEDIDKKLEIINDLEKIQEPEATDALTDILLNSKSEKCREGAAKALGKRKDPEGLDALIEKTEDSSASVRLASIRSLGNFKDTGALNCLVEFLKNKDGNIRKQAALSLKKMGDSRSLDDLIEAKKKEGLFSSSIRIALDSAIKQIAGDEEIGEEEVGLLARLIDTITRILFKHDEDEDDEDEDDEDEEDEDD